jgi:hypothetical protein
MRSEATNASLPMILISATLEVNPMVMSARTPVCHTLKRATYAGLTSSHTWSLVMCAAQTRYPREAALTLVGL